MKIIKRGKWIEECKFCKSLLEISADDLEYIGDWKEYSDANKVGFECPVCKNNNVLKKSKITQNVRHIVDEKYRYNGYRS